MPGTMPPKMLMYVGCCNRPLPYFATANGKGIAAFWFDAATGTATSAGITTGIDNPTFLAIDPDGRTVNATSEVLGWNEGTATAYAIDHATGDLSYLNKQSTRGSIAAHMCLDRTGRFLMAVNYGDGPMTQRPNSAIVVLPRGHDGELAAPSAEATHDGQGTDPARQDRPHAHSVNVTPDNRFLVVCDLGIDRLIIYRFDASTGAIDRHRETRLPSGSGPRHFVFHPSLPCAYVVNELNSTVASLSFDASDGRLDVLGMTPTLPDTARSGPNYCSEIRISADGRTLYVANRGHDSIARFAIDPATGVAALVDTLPCGGRTPRHFAIDPSGRYLAVANQDSDTIAVFAIDPADGSLRLMPKVIRTGTPTCVAFVAVPGTS